MTMPADGHTAANTRRTGLSPMKRIALPLIVALALSGCSGGDTSETAKAATSSAATTASQAGTSSAVSSAPEATVDSSSPAEDGEMTWKAGDAPITWVGGDSTATMYEFDLPVDMKHESITKMETLRKKLGGEPVTYLLVRLDATGATQNPIRVREVAWAAGEKTAKALPAEEAIDEWTGGESTSESVELTNWLSDTAPNVGAKGFYLMVAPGAITSMASPTLTTDGYETVYLLPQR